MTLPQDIIETVARALCQSGKFETGQGGCAAICMSVLGSARGGPHGCPHACRVHDKLAANLLETLRPLIEERDRQREALVAIRQSGIHRHPKWAGMNANDIARTALDTPNGEQ